MKQSKNEPKLTRQQRKFIWMPGEIKILKDSSKSAVIDTKNTKSNRKT